MEWWSTGVLGVKARKILVYILSPLFPAGQTRFIFSLPHCSTTPLLRIRLTSAFNKNEDNSLNKPPSLAVRIEKVLPLTGDRG
jgi:hypothetical protein